MRRVVGTRRIFCSNLTLVELLMLISPIWAIRLFALWERISVSSVPEKRNGILLDEVYQNPSETRILITKPDRIEKACKFVTKRIFGSQNS